MSFDDDITQAFFRRIFFPGLKELATPMPKIQTGGFGPASTGPTVQASRVVHNGKQRGPWVTFADVTCSKETDKAILVWFDDLADPQWIPKSHISPDSEVYKTGDKGQLTITEWIAMTKGLLDAVGANPMKPKPAADPPIELVDSYKLYRQLIRKYHPDVNPEPWAAKVTSDLTSLWYQVLKDGGKR